MNKSLRNQIIYQVFPRQHSKTSDFNGVTKDLDRIKELGVDIVYLLPIHPIGQKNKKGSVGCPYSIQDYRKVCPDLGTLEDFKKLIDETHKREMKLMIDVVYNHTSRDSVILNTHPEWMYKNEQGEFKGKVGDWWDVTDLDYTNLDLWDELMDNDCSEMHREPRLIFRTIQLLSVFYEVFAYISMVVILAIFLIIILNASTIIRQNVYEIGVMKALGAKTSELVVIFTLQMVITCLGVCLLLYSCSNIFMNFANKLLCSGISAYVVSDVLYNVIVFSPKFFIINIVSVSVFTIFSIMVPILAIRKIKPLKIIKTRN